MDNALESILHFRYAVHPERRKENKVYDVIAIGYVRDRHGHIFLIPNRRPWPGNLGSQMVTDDSGKFAFLLPKLIIDPMKERAIISSRTRILPWFRWDHNSRHDGFVMEKTETGNAAGIRQ
jgi:hypothetical protein